MLNYPHTYVVAQPIGLVYPPPPAEWEEDQGQAAVEEEAGQALPDLALCKGGAPHQVHVN